MVPIVVISHIWVGQGVKNISRVCSTVFLIERRLSIGQTGRVGRAKTALVTRWKA